MQASFHSLLRTTSTEKPGYYTINFQLRNIHGRSFLDRISYEVVTLEATMGLLDQLAGQALGAVGERNQTAAASPGLLNGLTGLINDAGGLPGLLQKFQASGLGDHVASWIGQGENQPVSGDQIKSALGEDAVAQLAQHAGVAPEHAAAGLAQILPQIIDSLTPNGQLPNNALVQQGLGLLKAKLFG
jgi:uncharacterized protein YidB (DUF937 family)